MKRLFLILTLTALCGTIAAQQKYHDAAMFNAPNGPVKYIEYESGCIFFAEDGSLIKGESSYLELFTRYDIKRDEEGYPILVTTDFDETEYEYDEQRRISKRIITGSSKLVFTYDYTALPAVKITLLEYKSGNTQKIETLYDMNGFDSRANWILKGIKGTRTKTQDVKQWYVGTAGDGYYDHFVIDSYKYVGQEKEARTIAYWHNHIFKRDNSEKEIELFEAMDSPFFFETDGSVKEVLQYIKKNKIAHLVEKGYMGERCVIIPESDKTFYGYPIVHMAYDYFNGRKLAIMYSFVIQITDKNERDDFLVFLAEMAKEQNILEEFENNKLVIEKRYPESVTIQALPDVEGLRVSIIG